MRRYGQYKCEIKIMSFLVSPRFGFRPERTLWNLVAPSLFRHFLGITRQKPYGYMTGHVIESRQGESHGAPVS